MSFTTFPCTSVSRRVALALPVLRSDPALAKPVPPGPSVVVPTRQNSDLLLLDLVDQAVFLVDPLRPATRQLVLEWLGFANAAERVVLGLLDQPKEAKGLLAVVLNPPSQVLEGRGVKF